MKDVYPITIEFLSASDMYAITSFEYDDKQKTKNKTAKSNMDSMHSYAQNTIHMWELRKKAIEQLAFSDLTARKIIYKLVKPEKTRPKFNVAKYLKNK